MFVVDVVINGTEAVGTNYECCGKKPITAILVSRFGGAMLGTPTLQTDLVGGAHA